MTATTYDAATEAEPVAGQSEWALIWGRLRRKKLARLLRERFAGSGTVRSTRTTVVLETLRESAQIPVAAGTVADPVKSMESVEKEEGVLL